jgi:hypothetical protein
VQDRSRTSATTPIALTARPIRCTSAPGKGFARLAAVRPYGRGGRSTRERTPWCGTTVVAGSASSSPIGGARHAWQDGIAGLASLPAGATLPCPGLTLAKKTRSVALQGKGDRALSMATSVASNKGGAARALAPRSSQKGAGGNAATAGRTIVHTARTMLAQRSWRAMRRVSNIKRGTLEGLGAKVLLSAVRHDDKPPGEGRPFPGAPSGRHWLEHSAWKDWGEPSRAAILASMTPPLGQG